MSLQFAVLREANVARFLPTFKNAQGELSHNRGFPPENEWSREDWLVAVGGEVGELLNCLKKVRRGDFLDNDPTPQLMIAKGLADIVIYLDLFVFLDSGDTLGGFPKQFSGVSMSPQVGSFKIASNAVELLRLIGRLARVTLNQFYEPNIPRQILSVLSRIAYESDIVLGDAVIQQFNEASDRLRSHVFIHIDGQKVITHTHHSYKGLSVR